MGHVHKFTGDTEALDWEEQTVVHYGEAEGARGATLKWIIGPAEPTPYFAIRYVEIEAGGWTPLDYHAHDHGVLVVRGGGTLSHGDEETELSYGDAAYIAPYERHQFRNTGNEPFGFICVVPQKRLLRQLKTARTAQMV